MKTLGIIIAVLLVLALGGLGYMGLFNPIEVQEREAGPYQFIYVQEPGSDSGKVGELTEALGVRLEEAGYRVRRPAQVFYPTGRGIQNQIGFVVDRPATREILDTDTFYRVIPAQRCMAARFPFRFALSYALGRLRVEPAFESRRKDRGYADTSAIVILEKDAILYLQPIEQG